MLGVNLIGAIWRASSRREHAALKDHGPPAQVDFRSCGQGVYSLALVIRVMICWSLFCDFSWHSSLIFTPYPDWCWSSDRLLESSLCHNKQNSNFYDFHMQLCKINATYVSGLMPHIEDVRSLTSYDDCYVFTIFFSGDNQAFMVRS